IDGCCGADENYNPPAAVKDKMPVIAPGLHTDPVAGYNSFLKIKQTADIIIPLHEPRFLFIDRIP
ncbi:N-acyl homoserine lactonase family protein, partial [Chloroflexota bacterium]